MSVCRPCNNFMIKKIKGDIAVDFYYKWHIDVECYYDGSPYCTKRDYVLRMTVGESWNSHDTERLREIIRKNGGTNIIGGARKIPYSREQFIDLAFDEKIRKNS